MSIERIRTRKLTFNFSLELENFLAVAATTTTAACVIIRVVSLMTCILISSLVIQLFSIIPKLFELNFKLMLLLLLFFGFFFCWPVKYAIYQHNWMWLLRGGCRLACGPFHPFIHLSCSHSRKHKRRRRCVRVLYLVLVYIQRIKISARIKHNKSNWKAMWKLCWIDSDDAALLCYS